MVDVGLSGALHPGPRVAAIAQVVERQFVVLDVTGSNPVGRPNPLFAIFVPLLTKICPLHWHPPVARFVPAENIHAELVP